MNRRFFALFGIATAALGGIALPVGPVAGQSATSTSKGEAAKESGIPLTTQWGDPDLQGTWTASGATPMERPAAYAGRATLTDEEVGWEARVVIGSLIRWSSTRPISPAR